MLILSYSVSNAMNRFVCSGGRDRTDKIALAPNALLSGDCKVNQNKARFYFRDIEFQEINAFAS